MVGTVPQTATLPFPEAAKICWLLLRPLSGMRWKKLLPTSAGNMNIVFTYQGGHV